jgi:exopolysaccharide biosynthesis polyprenyl glycosylphosphotransferase
MYNQRPDGVFKHLDFIILDIISLHCALVLAYITRMGMTSPYTDRKYLSISIVISLIDLLIIFLTDAMKNILKRGYLKEASAVIKQMAMLEAAVALYLFTVKDSETYSRIIFYLMGILYCVITYMFRLIRKSQLRKNGIVSPEKSMVLITYKDIAEEVLKKISDEPFKTYTVTGLAIVDQDMTGKQISGVPVVSGLDRLMDNFCHEWIDEVFIVIPSSEPFPKEMINHLLEMGITVHFELAESHGLSGTNHVVEKIGGYTVLTVAMKCTSAKNAFFKRCLDIAGGLVGCVLTGILCIILGPMIYIQSPGPIFFSQERVGKNGKKFKLYKFRSMYMDAEERKKELMEQNRVKDGMMFKLEWDPRIIGCRKMPDGTVKKGIGNFIRDWSLDEFPQFYNVLKGDMSLVGTRPPTVDEWEKYDCHHRARLAVKPGITGLWQVSGRSNIMDFEEVVKLDTKYIDDWSLGLDFKILLKTFTVVLERDGAM